MTILTYGMGSGTAGRGAGGVPQVLGAKPRRVDIVLTIGNTDIFLDINRHLSRVPAEKEVSHQMHVWDGCAHRAGAWRRMAALYI